MVKIKKMALEEGPLLMINRKASHEYDQATNEPEYQSICMNW